MIFDPVIPVPWIVLIAVVVMAAGVWFQFRSARHLGVFRNAFLLVTRVAALAVIVFLLLQPVREEKVPVPANKKSVILEADFFPLKR